MTPKLKPIDQQTIVITGATSGIGLATAHAAARAGAQVMLAARDSDALAAICRKIEAGGGTADYLPTDVGDERQVEALAQRTAERFGGFDTWVNNAGIGLISTAEKTSSADHAALFQTNYFGLVYGSLAAVRSFRDRGIPGALVNVGSVVGDIPMPLSVAYSATKHAVKGFTDGLRVELMQAGLPISVTLIKPSSIDTRFFDHNKSNMGGLGVAPGPQYAPDVVGDAILYAARHPKRHFPVGSTAVIAPAAERLAPGLVDKRLAGFRLDDLIDFGHRPTAESVHDVPAEGAETSRFGNGRHWSVSTSAQMHPRASLGAIGLGLVLAAILVAQLGAHPRRPFARH
jgi:short-subunit dehydrogenase